MWSVVASIAALTSSHPTTSSPSSVLYFMPDPSIRPKNQLFIVPASGGEARQATHAAFDVGSPRWTSDSRTIIVTGDEEADDELKSQPTVNLYAVRAEGGELKPLTGNPGSETQPVISPKGDKLAFLRSPARGAPVRAEFLYRLESRTPRRGREDSTDRVAVALGFLPRES